MSSQEPHRVPLIYNREQQGLRLLELPPELLDAVASSNPPRLVIKSAAASAIKPSHIVLCTRNQTYEIRQVQTSNQVYIIQSSETTTNGDDGLPQSILTAFATCTNTLELTKLDASDNVKTKIAKQMLLELLPTYHGAHSLSKVTQEEALTNMPYSEQECDAAWIQIMGFNLNGYAYKPSPSVLVALWMNLAEGLGMEEICISTVIPRDVLQQVVESLDEPNSLYYSMIRGLDSNSPSKDDLHLDKTRTMTWLGELVLREPRTDGFHLSRWKGLMPEQWRESVTIDLLASINLRLQEEGVLTRDVLKAQPDPAAATTSQPTKRSANSRNWHERLKRPKK